MSLVLLRLKLADVYQLRSYVADRECGDGAGWYYGDKEQFEKRHESIKKVLDRAIERAGSTSSGVAE